MNKRLSEIAQDVGISEEYLRNTNQWNMIEELAERIVRECATECDMLLNNKMSSEWSRGTHDCSKAIKQLFGVDQ